MKEKLDEIYKYSVELFGEDNVKRRDLHDPEALEVDINLSGRATEVSRMVLALYLTDPPRYSMHIGDYDFEYDDKEDLAMEEMKSYLAAASKNKLTIKSKSIFGIKYDKKIIIER